MKPKLSDLPDMVGRSSLWDQYARSLHEMQKGVDQEIVNEGMGSKRRAVLLRLSTALAQALEGVEQLRERGK